ncbi:TPA: IS630 family transposase, partial [Legionella pneumophila]|nr:IS630 family transposase [Legionella pneumophila]HBP6861768.1 IS630 family transposase [Legionella pneumophila]
MESIETSENNTKKKSTLYAERDEQKRQNYLAQLANHLPEKLVYIDESGIDTFIARDYGWSCRGKKILAEVSGRRYVRESFIAGLMPQSKKVVAPFCYSGTCDTTLFNCWLEQCLLPALGPGYTIIMDNATFHKSEKTKTLIHNAQCSLLFLPPYSPDFNPIEKFWANLKSFIRKIIGQFHSLSEAINYA